MLSWFQAEPKHLEKYCELYTNLGFDVLIVKINLLQLMRPVNGSQLVAAETWRFLDSNEYYDRVLIHGFSVGGYLWGNLSAVLSHLIIAKANICNIYRRVSCSSS